MVTDEKLATAIFCLSIIYWLKEGTEPYTLLSLEHPLNGAFAMAVIELGTAFRKALTASLCEAQF